METEAASQESIGGWTEVKPDSEKPAIPGVSLREVCMVFWMRMSIHAHSLTHRKKTSIKKPSQLWLVGL